MARDMMKLMEAAIVLAEELNFSRAAKKARTSQPNLTKQIAELEGRLGLLLFDRDRQGVTLTDAGRAYVEEARMCLLHGKRATQAAQSAVRDVDAVLNIGRSPYIDPFLISTLLALRLPLFPQLKIELSSGFSCDLVHDLLAGCLDLAVVTDPTESLLLSMAQISESPFYIAMLAEDQLSRREYLTLEMLDGREWVLFEREVHPPLYDSILLLAQTRAISPTKIHHVITAEEAFPFVARSKAVAFLNKTGALRLTKFAPPLPNQGVAIRPLREDALSLKTYLASRADNDSKLASELLRAFMRKLSQLTEVKQLSLPMSA
jgi:DNA-binding transcriptional LysR family regulator